MRSLRRLNIATFFAAALLLAALIFIGFRQNNLAVDYNTIVQESEGTIFLYATIKDQATEGLLSRNQSQLLSASKEFEQLQSRYTALLDNPLISAQYKLSFMRDLDLGRVIVNLRTLAEKPDNDQLILKITDQLRQMNKQFLQFDRIVVNEMRSRVMEYQKMAMVIMGTIISLVCFSLIMLYMKSVKPLIDIASQAEKAMLHGTPVDLGNDKGISTEVHSITNSINNLLKRTNNDNQSDLIKKRLESELSSIVNEATNRLNGIINYAQLLIDTHGKDITDHDQKEILKKIIYNGEQCAVTLKKGIQ